MASTQVARAAAQLHEAALDVARVAALRSAQPQEPANGPQVPQQPGHANNEDGDDGPVTAGTVANEMTQGNDPGGTPMTGTTARRRTVDHRPRPTHPPPRWPLKAALDLGAVLTAPGCARAWTREILWEWDAAELADDAELVASELVTNSVSACTGPDRAAIRLVLTLDQGELAVLVRDDDPRAPVAAQPGVEDESGRGLLIVEHLSDRCGWFPLQGARPAKVTWAVIAWPGWADGELPGRPPPGGLRNVGAADAAGSVPALPARPRRVPSLTAGTRAPRLVDLEILARVKAALERL
jgi:anti-sigma regulatory factor (Ser/Thr protein kinase)